MPILSTYALLVSALAGGGQAAQRLSFVTVSAGQMSQATRAMNRVFRTPQLFDDYWSAIFGSARKPTKVDWRTSELVAVHLGHRGSLGYQVAVDSVEHIGDHTVVHFVERLPIRTGKKAERATSPYVIVSFRAQPGKVFFRGTLEDPRHPFGAGEALPHLTFLSGAHCLLARETTAVIDGPTGLSDLWRLAFGRATPPPKVDFAKWRLVAIFLGQRPTPGYAPVVDGLVRIGPTEVQVRYSETQPEPDSILPQVVTDPFVILRIPVTGDSITVDRSP